MSKYTTEVRFICETAAGLDTSEGYLKTADIIEKARPTIFDFDYPIFDESYRSVLETKIIRHFYTREIAAETVGLWKLWLETKMNEIMPYYNQLYKSELIEFNPLYDVDLTTDHTKNNKGTDSFAETKSLNTAYSENNKYDEEKEIDRTSTTNGTSEETDNGSVNRSGSENSTDSNAYKTDKWEYYSDTPQEGINGVADLRYLTNARHTTDDGTGSLRTTNNVTSTNDITNNVSNGTTNTDYSGNDSHTTEGSKNTTGNKNETGKTDNDRNITGIETYIEHIKGKTPGVSFSKMLRDFRESMLNIDMMVINELNDLFFNLW